jgi:cell division protein FtsL
LHVCRSGQARSLGSPAKSDGQRIQKPLAAGTSQRGSSRLKLVGFLALLVAVIYVGVKVIHILVNNMQFQDAIQSTARFASVNRQSVDDIRNAVLKEAQNEDIPIAPTDIHVKGDGGHVEIAADYSVTVDLLVYQWTLNFHPYAKNNPLL